MNNYLISLINNKYFGVEENKCISISTYYFNKERVSADIFQKAIFLNNNLNKEWLYNFNVRYVVYLQKFNLMAKKVKLGMLFIYAGYIRVKLK